MEIEYTLEELKQNNAWLASENRRMIVTIDDLNGTIEHQQKNIDVMLEVLQYCSVQGPGTAYQQGDARSMVMQMNEPRYKSALKNIKDENVRRDLVNLKEFMSDRRHCVDEEELHRYFRFLDKYSTHKKTKLTKDHKVDFPKNEKPSTVANHKSGSMLPIESAISGIIGYCCEKSGRIELERLNIPEITDNSLFHLVVSKKPVDGRFYCYQTPMGPPYERTLHFQNGPHPAMRMRFHKDSTDNSFLHRTGMVQEEYLSYEILDWCQDETKRKWHLIWPHYIDGKER